MKYRSLVLIRYLTAISLLIAVGCSSKKNIVKTGDSVTVNYVLTLDDSTVVDSSEIQGQPLTFTVGAKQMIQGFDKAVLGMKVGETQTIRIPPEEGYGPYRPELVREIPRSLIPQGEKPEKGQTIFLGDPRNPRARPRPVTIADITDSSVIIDFNPPLAGKILTFKITVLATVEGPPPQ